MTPDLDTDPLLLLAFALVLWAVAALIGRRERHTARFVVLLAQRREDGGADDGVLDEQAEHQQQNGDHQAEGESKREVLRIEHAPSVGPCCAPHARQSGGRRHG